MTTTLFVTSSGDTLSHEEATQKLLHRVSSLEEQLELNTKVLRQLLNHLRDE